jgi:hypothetical protein
LEPLLEEKEGVGEGAESFAVAALREDMSAVLTELQVKAKESCARQSEAWRVGRARQLLRFRAASSQRVARQSTGFTVGVGGAGEPTWRGDL